VYFRKGLVTMKNLRRMRRRRREEGKQHDRLN
jgi:hypothetical protein